MEDQKKIKMQNLVLEYVSSNIPSSQFIEEKVLPLSVSDIKGEAEKRKMVFELQFREAVQLTMIKLQGNSEQVLKKITQLVDFAIECYEKG